MSSHSSPLLDFSKFSEISQSARLSRPVRLIDQRWPEGTIPLVSVFNWAYRHAHFIRESIDSILMQETTFPVEIMIHDDASTDGTAEIIREYESRYPLLFHNILQTENQWSQGKCVVQPLFNACHANFIALTHGDDYWTDPRKLESQLEYLTHNLDCAGCFHQSRLVDEKKNIIKLTLNKFGKNKYNQIEAFQYLQSSYATNSLFFRNNFELPLPDWYTSKPNDMALEVLLTQYGSLGYIDRNMSDYRKHSGGVWSQTSPEMQYFELMHRLQLWIDDPSFPNELKTEVRKKFTEVQEDRPSNHLIRELQERLKFANQETEMIRGSLSWKITEPLRYFHNLFKRKSG
jgi:glycosyltransferase involved in cell wall biosynthesis